MSVAPSISRKFLNRIKCRTFVTAVCINMFSINSRLNRKISEELGSHPGFFLFLNRLHMFVFQESMNTVIQVNNARTDKAPMTLAAKRLSDKSAKAEAEYAEEKISPSYLLRLVARHFDDEATITALNGGNNPDDGEPEQNPAPAGDNHEPASDGSQSVFASQLSQNDQDGEDEDDLLDEVDPTPEEDDTDDTWILSDDWEDPQPVTHHVEVVEAAPEVAPQKQLTDFTVEERINSLTVKERVDSLKTREVNDFIAITCQFCLPKNLDSLLVTKCQHVVCETCIPSLYIPTDERTMAEMLGREPRRVCPTCRALFKPSETAKVKTGVINVAWKSDLESEFSTTPAGVQGQAPQDDQEGNRPGDEPWVVQQLRDDEELARRLAGKVLAAFNFGYE